MEGQTPLFSRWTEYDERKLVEASETMVDIGHRVLGRMVETQKEGVGADSNEYVKK